MTGWGLEDPSHGDETKHADEHMCKRLICDMGIKKHDMDYSANVYLFCVFSAAASKTFLLDVDRTHGEIKLLQCCLQC